jgi:hypothetical protein
MLEHAGKGEPEMTPDEFLCPNCFENPISPGSTAGAPWPKQTSIAATIGPNDPEMQGAGSEILPDINQGGRSQDIMVNGFRQKFSLNSSLTLHQSKVRYPGKRWNMDRQWLCTDGKFGNESHI